MASLTINVAEIVEAIAAASLPQNPEDAHTAAEIANATGWSRDRTTTKLGILKRAGQLEVVSVVREDLAGRRALVPAYRFIGQKKGKRA